MSSIPFATHLGRYLGFPLLQGRVKKLDFNFLIEKMQSRLSGWNGRLLSKAGKVTLAKAIISLMLVYHMQSLWIQQGVCDSIDHIIRSFMWRGSDRKGMHLVNWEFVSRAKKEGGLGIRKARETNVAMFGKLIVELHGSSQKLWPRVLGQKYLPDGCIDQITAPCGSSSPWQVVAHANKAFHDGLEWEFFFLVYELVKLGHSYFLSSFCACFKPGP